MNIFIIVILALFVIGSLLISFKVFDITNKEILELSKHNSEVRYGLFYNSLIEDSRSFALGEIVWFYDRKYYVVKQETTPSFIYFEYSHLGEQLLHLSTTMNDVGYKEDGLVADSREVKKVVRFDK